MDNNMSSARNIKIKLVYGASARRQCTHPDQSATATRGQEGNVALDQWEKDLAPSTALSEWFGHDLIRQDEFRKRYANEVHKHLYQLRQLRVLARKGRLTLVRSTHDEVHNDAITLREVVLGRPPRSRSKTTNSRNSSLVFAGSSCSAGDFHAHLRELSDTAPTTA